MKKHTREALTLILLILIQSFLLRSEAQELIDLRDYGVKPWSFENASPAIVKAIDASQGKKDVVLKLPGGRIDLWPDGAIKRELYISNSTMDDTIPKIKTVGMFFEDFNGITIEGNQTTVFLHGKMMTMAFLNCKNVRVEGISFEFESPNMAELEVLDVNPDLVRVKIAKGCQYDILNGKLIFYGEGWRFRDNMYHALRFVPRTEQMFYSSWKPFSDSEAFSMDSDNIMFRGDFSNIELEQGDIITVRDHYRDNAGGFISHCSDVQLKDVNLHYINGMGLVSQFSENIAFIKVRVAPRKESGRVVAAWADCFHFSGCRGLITIDSCYTSGSHDDPINVHGTHLKIQEINGKNLVVRFIHHQTYGFEAFFKGDTVGFVKPEDLLLYGKAVIKSAQMLNKREMELVLDKVPGDIRVGDCLENITWTPQLVVKNSIFEHVNTRGLLVTTRRKVLIENNLFYRTGMHAILIANDCNFWFESGPVRDVTIRGNRFIQCGYNQGEEGFMIAIKPETHNFVNKKYIHSNIKIYDNEFHVLNDKVLFARSVDGLKFYNNKIFFNPLIEKSKKGIPEIKLEHCTDVEVEEAVYLNQTQ